ncbi:MAG: citrate synthase [Acidobacteria bacterium]|nr:MAG: citrate synthase [Acidobacteriota bacterium]
MSDKAILTVDGRQHEFDIIEGTEHERAIDMRKLRARTGLISFDPGYGNTGSCRSAITFIDGEKGILRYRGIPIEELAEKATFLETALLLINGELPKQDELDRFVEDVRHHTMLHEDVKRFYGGFPKRAHPMAVCSAVVAALSAFYPEYLNPREDHQVNGAVVRLIAKLPTIAAYSYKHSIGQPFMYPSNRLDYASNFLWMMFATPCEDYEVDPVIARALDLLLILHADHEQNCSTSTVRMVGSSMSNLFACISAGISALWGHLHGGANQKVLEMLQSIAEGEGSAEKFVEKAKSRDDTTRLMGFGHRVYKNYDPRAKIIKRVCTEVIERLGIHSKLLEIAMRLEEIALSDEYFISRKLYPNVDFYSGIIYQAIGIPVNMFTVLFAMGRLPGWIAQWIELHRDGDFRIARPRQVYVGPKLRSYVPISER